MDWFPLYSVIWEGIHNFRSLSISHAPTLINQIINILYFKFLKLLVKREGEKPQTFVIHYIPVVQVGIAVVAMVGWAGYSMVKLIVIFNHSKY